METFKKEKVFGDRQVSTRILTWYFLRKIIGFIFFTKIYYHLPKGSLMSYFLCSILIANNSLIWMFHIIINITLFPNVFYPMLLRLSI